MNFFLILIYLEPGPSGMSQASVDPMRLSTGLESHQELLNQARAELAGSDEEDDEDQSESRQDASVIVVEVEQLSDEDEDEEQAPPPKRNRPSTAGAKRAQPKVSAQPKAKPGRKAGKQPPAKKGRRVDIDNWTTWESIWPASERPQGQLQDRDWVNGQTYERISMMKKAGLLK